MFFQHFGGFLQIFSSLFLVKISILIQYYNCQIFSIFFQILKVTKFKHSEISLFKFPFFSRNLFLYTFEILYLYRLIRWLIHSVNGLCDNRFQWRSLKSAAGEHTFYINTEIFWSKIEILVENLNFGRKSKFWSKVEILVENWNFARKSKFWSTIEMLVENWNFGRKLKFGRKSKFWSKIELLVDNRNFCRKSNFWSTIEILVENWNFGRKLK